MNTTLLERAMIDSLHDNSESVKTVMEEVYKHIALVQCHIYGMVFAAQAGHPIEASAMAALVTIREFQAQLARGGYSEWPLPSLVPAGATIQ